MRCVRSVADSLNRSKNARCAATRTNMRICRSQRDHSNKVKTQIRAHTHTHIDPVANKSNTHATRVARSCICACSVRPHMLQCVAILRHRFWRCWRLWMRRRGLCHWIPLQYLYVCLTHIHTHSGRPRRPLRTTTRVFYSRWPSRCGSQRRCF